MIRSRKSGTLMEEIAAKELSHSEWITLEKTAQRRWWQRSVDALAWRLRRWL